MFGVGVRIGSRDAGAVGDRPRLLEYLAEFGTSPEALHDQNLRTDRGKLTFLARTGAGSGVIERLTEGDGTLEITRLETSFSLEDLTQVGKDPETVASLLYYLGLLTRTGDVPPRLRIPNLVVRKLFLDRLLEIFLDQPGERYQARRAAMAFFKSGDLRPLLDFFDRAPGEAGQERRGSARHG